MPETRQELELQLIMHLQEKKTNEDAIRHTRVLLDKADKRLRDNPADKSKWGRTLDTLEETLSEKKRLLTMSETNILQITRKLDQGNYAPEEGDDQEQEEPAVTERADEPEPLAVPDNLSLDDLKAAVKRVLSTHIIKVHSISDLDFKLAKALMGSRAAQSLSKTDTVEIRKRLSILEKSRGGVQRKAVVASESADSTDHEQIQRVVQSALLKSSGKKLRSHDAGRYRGIGDL
jgi:hypothetical protein